MHELKAKFKRGDIVRWNAIALHGADRDNWSVVSLEVKDGLFPIYRVRNGKITGSAVETELQVICKDCNGGGRICVGNSGQDVDGNAPIIERCETCDGSGNVA